MKKKLIVFVLLLAAGLVVWKIAGADKREGTAARYRDREITWTQVDRTRAVLSLLGEKASLSDRQIVDRILQGYILWDEAKALGVTVSESEVAQAVTQLPLPDGSSSTEDYLRKLGGSVQGYLDVLREQARSLLTMDRLREALARDYCSELGVEFDVDHLPEEVSRAVGERIDALIESHSDEIEYYF